MTLLTDHLWLLAFYIAAALLSILLSRFKLPRVLSFLNLLLHAAAIITMFLLGGTLEDVLLFLIFSVAVSLSASYFQHIREDNK